MEIIFILGGLSRVFVGEMTWAEQPGGETTVIWNNLYKRTSARPMSLQQVLGFTGCIIIN